MRALTRAIDLARGERPTAMLRAAVRNLRQRAAAAWVRHRSEDGTVWRTVRGSEMRIDANQPGLDRQLIAGGTRERYATEAFEAHLVTLAAEPRPVTPVDVGANIGYYALLEARVLGPGASVHAFEPEPTNAHRLRENVERNGYDSVTVHESAVGAEAGTTRLLVDRQPNRHRVTAVEERGRDGQETVEVPVTTVDRVVDAEVDHDGPVIVRIDVEGHEAAVFEGMADLLDSDRPLLVFVELHASLDPAETDAIRSAFRRSGIDPTFCYRRSLVADPRGIVDDPSVDDVPDGENVHLMGWRSGDSGE